MAQRAPRVSGSELIKALEHLGYFEVRTSGDHVRLHHHIRPPTTVPLHEVVGPSPCSISAQSSGGTSALDQCGRYTPAITTFCLRGSKRRAKVQSYRCAHLCVAPLRRFCRCRSRRNSTLREPLQQL